ncbi:MAG: hypothetical protein U0800_03105 [Isosphaeraceae bacterium]
MIAVDRMRIGLFEFAVASATFRRITQSWSGPGWDFNFSGRCLNDNPEEPIFLHGAVNLYAEAAPLPLTKADDYTGVELELAGDYDEPTGEPYFAIDAGESYETSDVRMRFVERDGSRYLVEMHGLVPGSLFGHPDSFELRAWAQEQPDHAYPA